MLPVVVTLVSVPIFIRYIGEARYGALSLVWLMSGFLLFLDFGVGESIRYEIARRHKSSDEERALVFWNGIWLSLAFGAVGAIIVYFGAWYIFADLVQFPDPLRREVLNVLPWISLGMPIATLEGLMTGALVGRSRFLALNVRRVIGTSIAQIFPLIAVVLIGPSLEIAIPASMLGKVCSLLMVVFLTFKAVPAGFRPRAGGFRYVRSLLSFGLWSSGGSFGRQLLLNADRFIVGAVLNTVAVALYSVPTNLLMRLELVGRSLADALYPRLTQTEGEDRDRLAARGLRSVVAVMTCVAAGVIVTIHPFLSIWVGRDFADKADIVGQLIAVSAVLTSVTNVLLGLLRASGRPRVAMTVLLLEVVPVLALTYFSTVWLGIAGAALMRIGRTLTDSVLLGLRAGQLATLAPLLLASIALLAMVAGVTHFAHGLTLIEIAAKLTALLVVGVWALFCSPDVRAFVMKTPAFAARLIRRGASS